MCVCVTMCGDGVCRWFCALAGTRRQGIGWERVGVSTEKKKKTHAAHSPRREKKQTLPAKNHGRASRQRPGHAGRPAHGCVFVRGGGGRVIAGRGPPQRTLPPPPPYSLRPPSPPAARARPCPLPSPRNDLPQNRLRLRWRKRGTDRPARRWGGVKKRQGAAPPAHWPAIGWVGGGRPSPRLPPRPPSSPAHTLAAACRVPCTVERLDGRSRQGGGCGAFAGGLCGGWRSGFFTPPPPPPSPRAVAQGPRVQGDQACRPDHLT